MRRVPDRSLLDPPPPGREARFPADFGQRVLLTVDTEEEFDWDAPFAREGHTLGHLDRLHEFQSFCEALGAVPVYLVDWPVATDPRAVEQIGDAVARGAAEVGVQLHPWVSPPFDEDVNLANSYAGNLPPQLERDKIARLRDTIAANFGTAPLVYRAGRYGLGPHTHAALRELGIPMDSSVRANFDYRAAKGPDYSRHPLDPYWAGRDCTLLELPLTTVFWGMLRRQGRLAYLAGAQVRKTHSLLARLGILERIALTPEGTTLEEAVRGIDIAIDDGLPVLVLSFHSPSIAPGHTPYVQSERDVETLYGWLRGVYAYLARRGVRPTTIGEIAAATGLR